MTETQIVEWLRKSIPRVILVEVDYMYQVGLGTSATPTVGTLYFSNKPYVDTATPRAYADCVRAVPTFQRSIDRQTLRGGYSVSFGNLELDNSDGGIDYMLSLPIDGSEVRVSVGESTWDAADFIQLYSARSVKASAPTPSDIIEIEIKDTSVLLNRTIGGTVAVGGTGPNADKFRPLNLGWVHQVEPLLADPATFKYAHSDTGTNTAAVNVRSNGVVLTGGGTDYTENGDGTFTLVSNPAGDQITCDVLATRAGGTTIGYRSSDVLATLVGDLLGLSAAGKYTGPQYASLVGDAVLNDYPTGLSISEARNAIDVINDLMDSRNGAWAIDRLGNFYYTLMRPDALSTIIDSSGGAITVADTINDDDIDSGEIAIDHIPPGFVGYQCNVNVNWTTQQQFAGSLTTTQSAQLSRKGFTSTAFYGEETTTQYLGATVPYLGGAPELYHLTMLGTQLVDTLISGASDTAIPDTIPPADSWDMSTYAGAWVATRRAQLLPWREFVDVTVGLDFYKLEIGHIVNIVYPRFDMQGGVLMQVCSVDIDPTNEKVRLGLVRRRFAGVSGPLPSDLLQETGDLLLQEDGSDINI